MQLRARDAALDGNRNRYCRVGRNGNFPVGPYVSPIGLKLNRATGRVGPATRGGEMQVRKIGLVELTSTANDELDYDYWTFEDGNVLNAYECPCGRCVN